MVDTICTRAWTSSLGMESFDSSMGNKDSGAAEKRWRNRVIQLHCSRVESGDHPGANQLSVKVVRCKWTLFDADNTPTCENNDL